MEYCASHGSRAKRNKICDCVKSCAYEVLEISCQPVAAPVLMTLCFQNVLVDLLF